MDERTLRVLEYEKVLELLADCAASSLGKERARRLQPETRAEQIRARLQETSEAAAAISRYGTMPLGGLTDVTEPLKKGRALVPLAGTEFLAVAALIRCGYRMREYFEEAEDLAPGLYLLAGQISDQMRLHDEIERVLDEDGEVRRNASQELSHLHSRQAILENRARDRMDGIMRAAAARELLQDPVIVQRERRFCLPVRSDRQSLVPGIVHDRSDSGATLFIEPMEIVQIGNELREIEIEIGNEIKRILRELTEHVGAASTELLRDLGHLTMLDFISARGRLSRSMEGMAPLVREDGVVSLRQARHPLLRGNIVPIDFWIGDEFDTLLITGPNTGGKTVALKTVGLLTLMAQAGLHIPAGPGSETNVFEMIWADIGDEQSIEQSLSTFSSHMVQIIKIISRADAWRRRAQSQPRGADRPGRPESQSQPRGADRPGRPESASGTAAPTRSEPTRERLNCLVLLDEVGAGTDPAEGAALGQAILEELHETGCRTVASTHYNDLKVFAYANDGMENASVEFDIKTLKPTYRLLIGQPGSSNALEISQRLGLPKRLTKAAREFLGGERVSVEDALKEMRQSHQDLERERQQTAKAERNLEKLRREYETSLQKLEAERAEQMEEGYERATQIVRQAEEQAREIIAELQRQPRQSKVTEEKRQQVARLREKIEKEARAATAVPSPPAPAASSAAPSLEGTATSRPATVRNPEIGDKVMVHSVGREGRVVEQQRDGSYLVEVGRLRVEASLADVEVIEPVVSEDARRLAAAMQMRKGADFEPEIDLRGTTVDEAITELEKYLDDAALAGVAEARILHGKGTGALRQGIQKFLRSVKAVKSFAIAPYRRGGPIPTPLTRTRCAGTAPPASASALPSALLTDAASPPQSPRCRREA
jgi:DNA mismatch repair protein MutS2